MVVGYKDTPIGKIPEDWDVVKLGDKRIAEIRGNKSVSGVDKIAFIPMELIPDSGICTGYEIRKINEVKSSTYCEAGDLLLAKITPSLENGKQGIVPDDIPNGFALATTEVFPIVCKGIDRLFLFYILKHPKFRKILEYSMRGTTGRQRVPKEAVENLLIPFPPLSEQKKIAEILSTVDKAIEKVDEAIAKTERLKKGLMQELLTKGIGHKEFKYSKELGCEIPKEWRVLTLKEIAKEFISGGTPSTKEPRYWNGDIPWIRSVHLVKYYIDDSLIEQYITKEGLENSAAKIIPKNNVIIATRVGIGKAAVNLIDVAINQDLTGVILNKSLIDPFFLGWYLISPKVVKKLESFSRGTTIKGIPQKVLKNLPIPLPPLKEQQKIAEILSTVEKKLELERKSKEKLERIKKGLMNDLLTGKRRVKVGV